MVKILFRCAQIIEGSYTWTFVYKPCWPARKKDHINYKLDIDSVLGELRYTVGKQHYNGTLPIVDHLYTADLAPFKD